MSSNADFSFQRSDFIQPTINQPLPVLGDNYISNIEAVQKAWLQNVENQSSNAELQKITSAALNIPFNMENLERSLGITFNMLDILRTESNFENYLLNSVISCLESNRSDLGLLLLAKYEDNVHVERIDKNLLYDALYQCFEGHCYDLADRLINLIQNLSDQKLKNLIKLERLKQKGETIPDFEKYFMSTIDYLLTSKHPEKALIFFEANLEKINKEKLDRFSVERVFERCVQTGQYDLADHFLFLKPSLIKDFAPFVLSGLTHEDDFTRIDYLIDKGVEVDFLILHNLIRKNQFVLLDKIAGKYTHLNLQQTDNKGHTILYFLKEKNPSKELVDKFIPPVIGLSQTVVDYLVDSHINFTPEMMYQHLNTLINSWKTEKTDGNLSALRDSTLIFLEKNFHNIFTDKKNIPLVIALFHQIKGDPFFERTVISLSKQMLSLGLKKNVIRFLEGIKQDVNINRLPRNEITDLILNSLDLNIKASSIADILLDLEPTIISNPNESVIVRAVKEKNIYALNYWLQRGKKCEDHECVLVTALENYDRDIFLLLLKNKFDVNKTNFRGETPLHIACVKGLYEAVEILIDQEGINPSVLANSNAGVHENLLPIQYALNRQDACTHLMLSKFGKDQFKPLAAIYQNCFANFFGLSSEYFDEIAFNAFNIALSNQPHNTFEQGILIALRSFYDNFWNEMKNDPSNFEATIEKYPLIKGNTHFLNTQKNVFDLFQQDLRTRHFPMKELWRFGIDFDRQPWGPYAFENEPGYLRSFMEGMIYALNTKDKIKDDSWYMELHKHIVSNTLKSESGSLLSKVLNTIPIGPRKKNCGFSIETMDRDPIGQKDLKERYPTIWTNGLQMYSPPQEPGEMESCLKAIFDHFNAQYQLCTNRAQKLVLFLSIARELEVVHVFSDANGRASNLALLSMVLGEKDLPAFMLPDPNCFDGNGPESMCTRYLEGCLNFRKQGHIGEVEYERSSEVKELDRLDLTGHEDLITLREELRPLVIGKEWSNFSMFKKSA